MVWAALWTPFLAFSVHVRQRIHSFLAPRGFLLLANMRVQVENTANEPASQAADPFTSEIRSYIEHLVERFHVPSISIGIIQNGQAHLAVRLHSFSNFSLPC